MDSTEDNEEDVLALWQGRETYEPLLYHFASSSVKRMIVTASSISSYQSLDSSRSPADRKSYRLLTLPNGLEVILIQSDNGSVVQSTTCSTIDLSGRSNASVKEDSETERVVKDKVGTDERVSALAAVCLAVNVGSLADPKELPGLAHYLEHMIFMGSEKYPTENAFEAYLSAHGGSCNGATECESTRFVFDVDATYLAPALDMFAHLFVAPLLRCEAMESELKVIESEFQRVRNNNLVRLQQVMCETSIEGHPYSRCFIWGNMESLKYNPERNSVDVREQMLHFFKRHYVAPSMKLCVYGSDSLDVLEQYVAQSFNSIPRFRESYDLLGSEKLVVPYGGWAGQKPMLLRVIPVGEKRTLQLYWMLPSTVQNYRQKPWRYVGRLLEHEGPTSIASMLKRKQWATDVKAGTSDRDGYEFGSFGIVFEIKVSLTDRGLACWDQVVQVIFDALHLFSSMATNGNLPTWLFEELRIASEMEFRFQEDDKAPVALCRDLSERMLPRFNVRQHRKEDLLRYDLIQGEFDSGSVCDLLTSLSTDSVRIVLMASSFTDALNSGILQTEKWFGTKYTVGPILDTEIATWSRSSEESIEHLSLPAPNPFMPQNFSILPVDPFTRSNNDLPPNLILTTTTTQLWYKRDQRFMVPKASISFLVAFLASTATSCMLAELYVELVRTRLQHVLEQADNAKFDAELDVRDEAIEVVITGFNDTLPALVRIVMQELLSPPHTNENLSELLVVQGELERSYRNATLSPKAKASEIRLHMLESRAVTTKDKLVALQSKRGQEMELFADLTCFANNLLGCGVGRPVIQCLIIGNLSREAAISLVLDVESFITKAPISLPQNEPEVELEPNTAILAPRYHTIALPLTANGLLIRRGSERIEERNSLVEVYFQIGKVCPADRAYAVLLRALLAQPLYHEMRTKQQLGYAVTCSVRDTHNVLGLSVSVQSASHAAGDVAIKLDKFLHEDFFHDYLLSEKRLSPICFATHVQSLQRLYARPDSTLNEQSERYWEEIVGGHLEFDMDARVAIALADCTREGLLARYQCWLQGSTSFTTRPGFGHQVPGTQHKSHGLRKLRVHIVGQTSPFKPFEELVPPEKTPVIIANDLLDFKRALNCHCH